MLQYVRQVVVNFGMVNDLVYGFAVERILGKGSTIYSTVCTVQHVLNLSVNPKSRDYYHYESNCLRKQYCCNTLLTLAQHAPSITKSSLMKWLPQPPVLPPINTDFDLVSKELFAT